MEWVAFNFMEWVLCECNGLRVDGLRMHGMGCVYGMGLVRVEWVAYAWIGLRLWGFVRVEWVLFEWNGLRIHGMGCVCMEWNIFVLAMTFLCT